MLGKESDSLNMFLDGDRIPASGQRKISLTG
jgi:hypothetical protein